MLMTPSDFNFAQPKQNPMLAAMRSMLDTVFTKHDNTIITEDYVNATAMFSHSDANIAVLFHQNELVMKHHIRMAMTTVVQFAGWRGHMVTREIMGDGSSRVTVQLQRIHWTEIDAKLKGNSAEEAAE